MFDREQSQRGVKVSSGNFERQIPSFDHMSALTDKQKILPIL
jgi:hypothetical protein